MRWWLAFPLFIVAAVCAFGAAGPFTVKELALMLRSGYSSETVLRELSVRHLGEEFDAEAEKKLVGAGASLALIEALRSGQYQASAAEISAVKNRLMAVKEENAGSLPTQPNESLPQTRPAATAPPHDSILSRLKGDLVYLHQGAIVPFDDDALENKKFYLLFFSANWSAAGRQFTARLVDYYNRTAAAHPEFEVIFFSADRSQFGMETYMTQSAMPWPAVGYEKRSGKSGDISSGLVREIPSLVLAEATGRVVSYSHADGTPVSLEQVLHQLDATLNH